MCHLLSFLFLPYISKSWRTSGWGRMSCILLFSYYIWWFQKTFFRAENREKSASVVFSGLSRRVDCTIKNSKFRKIFCLYCEVQSFFQKPLFARRFCSSWATGMFDTSNCSKFSLVGQLKFWPEVDFRFLFFKPEVVLNTFFLQIASKKIIFNKICLFNLNTGGFNSFLIYKNVFFANFCKMFVPRGINKKFFEILNFL